MNPLPELLGGVLKNFAHVEWYEVHELAELVRSGNAQFDVSLLKSQLEAVLADPAGSASVLNKLTSNEFESDEEARAWLEGVYREVFG